MEEIIKGAKTKKVSDSKAHQVMMVLTSTTIRGIVRAANEKEIKREDIVSLIKENGQFILIYFE